MRLLNRLLGSLLVGLSVFLTPLANAQQVVASASEKIGTMKLVEGEVKVISLSGTQVLAKSGHELVAGDKLVSGNNGSASLVLRDGTVLMLSAKSTLDLKNFTFDSTTNAGSMLLSLTKGTMRAVTGLIAKRNPNAVEIKTPTLSVGVRGTDFVVNADDPNNSEDIALCAR